MTSTRSTVQLQERRAGLLLLAAAGAALLLANLGWADGYHHLLETRVGPPMPRLGTMTIHQWVADGLMAIFFLLVGLEVKREWLVGQLSTPAERRLPIIAAAAGMAIPALVYLGVTGFDPRLISGWAIPAATDIAFAIGVLAILGRHAPAGVKLLLVTIAIVDDIGAVIVIALAYSADLDGVALAGALGVAAAMAALGQFGVRRLWPFLAGFVLLWLLVLASGVHPTIAGVLAALTVPLAEDEPRSPLLRLEHAIHPWVMFGIVPLFGFVSAGVSLDGGFDALVEPLPLAILLGLFVGKQAGVFGALWATIKAGIAPMPRGVSWRQLYGAATLCGIGFTMSLFIGALAFPADSARIDSAKLGTLAGSLLSALAGYLILRTAPPAEVDAEANAEADDIFSADDEFDYRPRAPVVERV
ncbi:MAG: Na+/H+ antiporter NhaA [Pseudomonadota bacterium]|nr:Na+/H+ antiporter NhaA [Pseudomonadota bacterium]